MLYAQSMNYAKIHGIDELEVHFLRKLAAELSDVDHISHWKQFKDLLIDKEKFVLIVLIDKPGVKGHSAVKS